MTSVTFDKGDKMTKGNGGQRKAKVVESVS